MAISVHVPGNIRFARHRENLVSDPILADLVKIRDCVLVAAAGLFARPVLVEGNASSGYVLIMVAVLATPKIFALARIYEPNIAIGPLQPLRLAGALAAVMFLQMMLIVGTEGKLGDQTGRIMLWLAYSFAALMAARLLFERSVARWRNDGRLVRKVVVVGSHDITVRVAAQLREQLTPGLRLAGVFCEPSDDHSEDTMVRWSHDLVRFVQERQADHVIVALPWGTFDPAPATVQALRNLAVDVLIHTPVSASAATHCGVSYLGSMPLLRVSARPIEGWSYLAKEVEDRLLAGILITLFAPLMLAIALLIRLDSPGPILFRQKRHGFNNSLIEVLKFRTMYVNAGQNGSGVVDQARRGDPRVTQIGAWLRRTSLDELPQLFNVLAGQMSMVGPRPHAVAHNEYYGGIINSYLGRHRVKPGITGLAQIRGLRGETDTVEKMQKRITCDLAYIDQWSVLLDLAILASTPFAVISQKNAY